MKKYKVPAVERAFQIIDMLAMSSIGLTKTDIASKLEIPYSTAFNLLNTMEGRGYARKDEASGKYYLGFKFLSLANAQKSSLSLREIAAPVLEKLVAETGITAHLAILERGEAIYIDKCEAMGFFKINTWVGKRNYVHTSAIGKALIAELPDQQLREIWDQGLPKRTAKSITSFERLQAALRATRKKGYAIDDEEDELGGRCVAAPVRDVAGQVVAAIGISGAAAQLPDSGLTALCRTVKAAAAEISTSLGHRPSVEPPGPRSRVPRRG
jgi:DNA-binding IclR family transcriptional regulator